MADDDLQALREELRRATPFRFVGRPVQLTFAATGTQTEVLHGCAEIPDGFLPLRANGAVVSEQAGVAWTKDLAYLRSTVATQVVGVFFKLREDPLNVAP